MKWKEELEGNEEYCSHPQINFHRLMNSHAGFRGENHPVRQPAVKTKNKKNAKSFLIYNCALNVSQSLMQDQNFLHITLGPFLFVKSLKIMRHALGVLNKKSFEKDIFTRGVKPHLLT